MGDLPPEGRERDLAHLRCFDEARLAYLVGQIRMNAVEVVVPPAEAAPLENSGEAGPPAVGIALHLVASAANHACDPNCSLQSGLPMPELRGWAVLQSVRPLRNGEELTIAYVPPGPSRRSELKEQWLFDCRCGACDVSAR